jgi:hypothetical protein
MNWNKLKVASHAATAAVSLKKQRKAGGTEPNSQYEYVGVGVFVKVDMLRRGDVFVSILLRHWATSEPNKQNHDE